MIKWLPVVDWPGYEVSDRGEVRSLKTGRTMTKSLMLVSGKDHPERAYYSVRLSGGIKRHRGQPYVHTLVLEAFAGPRPEGQESLHGIGGRLDNCWPENLKWGTHRENIDEAVEIGVTDNGSRKLSPEIAEVVKELLSLGATRSEIAKELNVTRHCIRNIAIGKTWTKDRTRASRSLCVVGPG